jgi:polysaccharide chain length determinant protein (PEP-CTERM system associated)
MQELVEQVLSHVKATWRYRWYAVGFSWTVALLGWGFVYQMPDRYEATARVYVDTQSVLRPLLSGLAVQPNVDQMVTMMSRTLVSRPNLEKVIRMSDLDIKLKTPEEREELIAHLGKELTMKSAGKENLYTIAYAEKNPQEAKRVVQSLLTIFVEGSLGDKRKDSDTARRFLDEQLKAYSEKLLAAENAVTEFKRKNVGLMPRQGQDYYSRVGEAQAALNQAELELKEAENARDAIKKQLGGENEMPNLVDEQRAPTEVVNPEIDGRILALEQKLDALRLAYTERHPDIVSILRVINQLKEQKKAEAKLRKPAPAASPSVPASTQAAMQQQLSVSLAVAEAGVASMKARVAEYRRRFEALKAAVHAQPQVEAEYTQLTRDYEVTRANYEKLLSRREQAQISGEMESNASVMDFRVIDPPQVPLAPNAPNRVLLMSAVLLASLGGGIAFAFLMSQVRPTFNDERRLREVTGLPVFGTVQMAWTDAQRARRKKGLIALMLSVLSLLSAYGAIMAALMLGVRV